jgi:hypothetical protein
MFLAATALATITSPLLNARPIEPLCITPGDSTSPIEVITAMPCRAGRSRWGGESGCTCRKERPAQR